MKRMERMKQEAWKIAAHGTGGFRVITPEGDHFFNSLKDMVMWELEDDPGQLALVKAAFERADAA